MTQKVPIYTWKDTLMNKNVVILPLLDKRGSINRFRAGLETAAERGHSSYREECLERGHPSMSSCASARRRSDASCPLFHPCSAFSLSRLTQTSMSPRGPSTSIIPTAVAWDDRRSRPARALGLVARYDGWPLLLPSADPAHPSFAYRLKNDESFQRGRSGRLATRSRSLAMNWSNAPAAA